jgi:2-dehydropantoate 2-reductase
MKILIYGAGVIGSIFAGKLGKAGHDVTMLARGKRFDELVQKGLILKKAYSKVQEITHPKIIGELKAEDFYDYIMVVVQKQQVADILPILGANCSRNIVFVVNTPSGYEEWVSAVGKERVMIGFPAAGGERQDGIVSYFIMNGLLRQFQTTTFGEYDGQLTNRLKLLIKSFNKAGIGSVSCLDMNSWQKYHVAMIGAIADLLYVYDADNYEASRHYKDIVTCVRAIQEGFLVLKTLGHRVTPGKMRIYQLPAPMVARIFQLILKTRFSETVMAKHTKAGIVEVQGLQKEFDCLIKKSGVKTPNIDQLRSAGLR